LGYSLHEILDEIRYKRDIEIDVEDYSDPRTLNQLLKTLAVHRTTPPYPGVSVACSGYSNARLNYVNSDNVTSTFTGNFNGNTKVVNLTTFAGLKSVLNDLPQCSCYARALWCTCNARDACVAQGSQCIAHLQCVEVSSESNWEGSRYWCQARCGCNYRASVCPGRCGCNARTGSVPLEYNICRCNQVHPSIVNAVEYQTSTVEPYYAGGDTQKTSYNHYQNMTCLCNVQHYFSNDGPVTGTVPTVESSAMLRNIDAETKDYLTLLNAINNNIPIVYK
jgi:hypothetical protein